MAAPRKSVPRKRAARVVKVKSLPEVVAEGDRTASLLALRDELARRLVSAEREVPAIARQLVMVLRELDELQPPASESKLDDLASKRAARIAAAQGS